MTIGRGRAGGRRENGKRELVERGTMK